MTQVPGTAVLDTNSRLFDRRRAVRILLAIPVRFGLLAFLPAGTLDWPRGWLFVLVSLTLSGSSLLYLWRKNPDVLAARSRYRLEAKRWDKILLCFYLPTTLAILVVAALDDGRLHWHHVSWRVVALGYTMFVLGMALLTASQAANRFFESMVRIQTDRDHRVISTGPYRYVRHPGYAAGLLIYVGQALALGSFWALIPAGIACSLLILRIRWEDATLLEELPGYQQYAHAIRFRLVPGFW
ncbi:MAG TPA: isoprenylcysteine carboxylmethyltransferase family protein [Planctomycetaceae bacterium]|nr:isoprenylcysteine carboxylmethyltransferase family protein [Planctomycetaceae bacterium]